MDPSGVLLALEERKKWRERRERIRERMRQLERRKAYLELELDRVRKMVARYTELLTRTRSPQIEAERPVPLAALR